MIETIEQKPETQPLDIASLRRDFPILERTIHGRPLVYLDSAATTQKPRQVIDALQRYYEQHNSNVHRGMHTLASEATEAYEATRCHVARFIHAPAPEQIIFTRSTTEAINLVAYSWGEANIEAGDRILLTEMEHHANHVPWLRLAEKKGAHVDFIPVDDHGLLELDDLRRLLTPRTKLVAVSHMSNVLGTINPVRTLIQAARVNGAVTLLDAAQSVPHMPVDVQELDADFIAFSAHKMLGPTGVGFLYGRRDLLENMEPFNTGGEMISEVTYDRVTWAELPHKFEAGTPNIAGVAATSEALRYLEQVGMDRVREHEREITAYALERLRELDFIRIIGPLDANLRGGAVSFAGGDFLHPHDIAQMLDSRGIAVRAGHHCAQPLHRKLGLVATARASFYLYNTLDEVDALVDGLIATKEYFGV